MHDNKFSVLDDCHVEDELDSANELCFIEQSLKDQNQLICGSQMVDSVNVAKRALHEQTHEAAASPCKRKRFSSKVQTEMLKVSALQKCPAHQDRNVFF